MEVIAVGANIAGLLSLAGQCISGAQRLIGLYQDVSRASKTIETFLKDINGLLRTLHDVEYLLERIREKSPFAFDDLHMTTLKLQLEDCDQDLSSWIGIAQAHGPFGKGTRAWFKEFWIAVNKDPVKNIRSEIQKRRTEIGVALSILGRSFDCQLGSTTAKIDKNVQDLVAFTPSYLDRLEALSQSISDSISSFNSPQVVHSSASKFSESSTGEYSSQRTRRRLKVWGCNQWSDWDVLFGPLECGADGASLRGCVFCGLLFAEPAEWDIRIHHMRNFHRLGRCRPLDGVFTTLRLFIDHLRTAHEAIIGKRLNGFLSACESKTVAMRTGITNTFERCTGTILEDSELHTSHGSELEDPARNNLMSSSWDAGLLIEWDSTRDRINRWILHALGTDDRQADVHREYCLMEQPQFSEIERVSGKAWSRLVIKYWFLDEAATGLEFGATRKSFNVSPESFRGFDSSLRGRSRASSCSRMKRSSTDEAPVDAADQ